MLNPIYQTIRKSLICKMKVINYDCIKEGERGEKSVNFVVPCVAAPAGASDGVGAFIV